MTDTAVPPPEADTEILEKLRDHFQTKVNNLSGDEMAEGPFENPDDEEFGDTWQAAAAVIDRRGGLRIRFEFGDAEAETRPHDDEPETCPFILDGRRCTLKADHPVQFHRFEDGSEVDSQGREIDRSRFLGFTSHGHPVDTKTVPDGVEQPNLVARCMGPAMCPVCARDAERIRGEAAR